MEGGREALSRLSSLVSDLVGELTKSEHMHAKEVLEAREKGEMLLLAVIAAKANLGSWDARFSDKDGCNWLETHGNQFLFSVQLADIKIMGEKLPEKIKALNLTMGECRDMLNEKWNSELQRCPELQRKLKRIVDTDSEEGSCKVSVKHKKRKGKGRGPAKKGKAVYRLITPPPPKIPADSKIECQVPDCPARFSYHSAMKTHMKNKHPGTIYNPPPKQRDPVTGRLKVENIREDKVGTDRCVPVLLCSFLRFTAECAIPPRSMIVTGSRPI